MNNDFVNVINTIFNEPVVKVVISNIRNKNQTYKKIIIERKKEKYFASKYTGKKVYNDNIKSEKIKEYLYDFLTDFKQFNLFTDKYEYTIKISKKNKLLIGKCKTDRNLKIESGNNKKKNYILTEGMKIAPLIDMGIFTPEGKVINSMYDKYRQINRFIEIIDDALKNKDYHELNIIDFGCGKSYLTFIIYFYLTQVRNIKANIVGLDLKEDVIKNCNNIAKKYGYSGLKFEVGDINGYDAKFNVDMVVTLHACDTATDYALYNAIKWNSKMIFSVPCCQHELNLSINPERFEIVKRYGIAKERLCALYTDIIRCNLLEIMGYKTQLLEFVDFDSTPKNLLIRASLSEIPNSLKNKLLNEIDMLLGELNAKQTLYELLKYDIVKFRI